MVVEEGGAEIEERGEGGEDDVKGDEMALEGGGPEGGVAMREGGVLESPETVRVGESDLNDGESGRPCLSEETRFSKKSRKR